MRLTITVILALCLAGSAFASGERQYEEVYPGWYNEYFVEEMPELQVYTGTFRMEEGEYPAILSDEGKLYYLNLPDGLGFSNEGANLPPAEGAALSIEAFKAPFSPVHLMVVSAKVNGEEIDLEWYDYRRGNLGWYDYRRGRWFGAYGRRGWRGYFRGYHHGPGWGGPYGRGYHHGPGWGGSYGPDGPWGSPDWDYPGRY